MNNIATIRRFIELQGFTGLDDETLLQVNYWLRLAPAICMAVTAIGTALSNSVVIWALVPFAVLGALRPSHPFDVIYNHGLRHLVNGAHLPPYPLPRRFACAIASVWLIATAWSFDAGAVLAAQILGWSLVGAALVNVTTGFCIPSFVYRLVGSSLAAKSASSEPGV